MKDVRWTQRGHRGKGLIFKYVRTKLEIKFFYWSRQVVLITLRSGVQSGGRALKWIIQYVLLVVGPLPPTSTS